jgi:hypothetical protein
MIQPPSARCYPNSDADFAAEVGHAIVSQCADPDRVLEVLRAKYPSVRIAVRDPLANIEATQVWYCYRDGKLIMTSDGAGAMRLWTPIERATRESLDLVESSSELMRSARTTRVSARAARAVRRPTSGTTLAPVVTTPG